MKQQPGVSLLEAAYPLAVAGAAMLTPWLALVVAAVYLVAIAYVNDHRAAGAES